MYINALFLHKESQWCALTEKVSVKIVYINYLETLEVKKRDSRIYLDNVSLFASYKIGMTVLDTNSMLWQIYLIVILLKPLHIRRLRDKISILLCSD